MHIALANEVVQEYWKYRELFYFFVWRDIKIRYKQTVLGATWAILKPVVTMIVFSVVFGNLAKIPSDGLPYPIFSYSALVPWTFFSVALSNAGNSLVNSAHLITKIYFPRAILPIAGVLSGLFDFFIASIVLIGLMWHYNIQVTWGILLWPVLVIPLMVVAIGAGMIFSSLNVRYRDIRYALGFVIQLWLFVTPIIYPTSIIPERFQKFTALNPLAGIIEAFRAAILPTREINWGMLGTSLIVAMIILVIGILLFRKTEKEFADIV
jgi:lipopolysaccharide transport system permease protein